MNQIRVLLAEDEAPTRNFLTQALLSQGIHVTAAENGEEAWKLYQTQSFSVILTDLDMPIMRGEELISRIFESEPSDPPMIIVLTSHSDAETIIDVMKMRVLDYLIKPAKAQEIVTKVKFAAKSFDLNRMQNALEKEKEIRLKEQLDWIKYKDEIKNKESSSFNDNLIHNMRHNLGQTGGFGNLVSLLELVYSSAKKEGEEFVIANDIFELLRESVQMIDKTFTALESISRISEAELALEKIPIQTIYERYSSVVSSFSEIAKIGEQSIIMGDAKNSFAEHSIYANLEFMEKMIREILLNACKFSERDSKIFLIFRVADQKFYLSVVSEPSKNSPIVGVPIEYSNLVFEPFFRIHKFVFEKYESMDLGLGLSMVKAVIKKMKGEISLTNIKDFISLDAQNIRVNLEIQIPLA
jgi:DNA-binding response OmpR family regulator